MWLCFCFNVYFWLTYVWSKFDYFFCVSVSGLVFQEILSGCQVRSRLYPPGTWSESLSASASPSASKVQTWQPESELISAAPSQNQNQSWASLTTNCHLVDERALQISLGAFVEWAEKEQGLPTELRRVKENLRQNIFNRLAFWLNNNQSQSTLNQK